MTSVGIPKETAPGERRVALTSDAAGRLVKAGFAVVVERGAGESASFTDDAYREAGATTGDAWAADLVAKVQKPSPAEVQRLREEHRGTFRDVSPDREFGNRPGT